MKILLLYHTSWSIMLLKALEEVPQIKVEGLPMPVTDWDVKPGLKQQVAGLIVDFVETAGFDLIIDVNGTGLLPLTDDGDVWTATEVGIPWLEWWWDDPAIYAAKHADAGSLDAWTECLLYPDLHHFCWDQVLALEYSQWTGKTWRWLPTAVHPDAFSPRHRAVHSREPDTEVTFLGTFYDAPADDIPESIRRLSEARLSSPEKTYFELMADLGQEDVLADSGMFSPDVLKVRQEANQLVGHARRTVMLHELNRLGLSTHFRGDNWPTDFKADPEAIANPVALSGIYVSSGVCLDLGNAQSFTGTNMRCYEIMSAGGILASLRYPDFDPQGKLAGTVYLHAESIDKLREQSAAYNHDSDERRKMTLAAREYAIQNHSWLHRFVCMIELLSDVT